MQRETGQIRGALIALIVSVAWAVLANRRPELTYHFAPLLAAMAWPISLRIDGRRTYRDATVGAIGAFLLVSAFGVVLQSASALEGPTFWNDGPSLTEAIVFALLGSSFGARVASRKKPGVLGSLFQLQ